MTIGKVKLYHVINKTAGHCAYCGTKISNDNFTIDHIIPVSKGGTNDIENLFLCCKECNSIKYTRDLEKFRLHLTMKELNIPEFTEEQLEFLTEVIPNFKKFIFPDGLIRFYFEWSGVECKA